MKDYFFALLANPFFTLVILKVLWALAIVIAALVANKIARKTVKKFEKKYPQAGNIIAVIKTVVTVTIWVLAVLMILQMLGVAITPILAAFGVGGLALALSVQDSLTNLFAGLHVLISHQIKVGDVIELDGQYRGKVVDILWRYTVLEVSEEEQIIIPNSKIAQTIIKRMRVQK